jgi:hypothetical protein
MLLLANDFGIRRKCLNVPKCGDAPTNIRIEIICFAGGPAAQNSDSPIISRSLLMQEVLEGREAQTNNVLRKLEKNTICVFRSI